MKKTNLRIASRVMPIAVIAALVCIGCSDEGVQDKNPEVGEFVNMFVGGGAQYTLSVGVSPTGSGYVLRTPDSISYKAGKKVTVTAKATAGFRFAGWTGDVINLSDSITVTMSKDIALMANFIDIYNTPYTITVKSEPNNGGSVAYTPVKTTYSYGDTVTVTATPAYGYAFAGWSGASTSTAQTIKIMMDNHKTLTASFKYSAFTDSRDGQIYKMAQIGNQMWMAENLNYQPSTGNSWCYSNNVVNCNTYGRLYDWATAMTACPNGWHLPSRQEWEVLVTAAGGYAVAGKMLKSTSGWNDYNGQSGNGSDVFGFSALPAGYRNANGSFYDAGNRGLWWTATENGGGYAYRRDIDYNYDDVYESNNDKGYGFSVRCVQDD